MPGGCFAGYWYNEKYIFLFPLRYPKCIRFHIETEKIDYIDGIQSFEVQKVENEWRRGGICPYKNELIFASPEDDQFLFMDIDTLEIRKEAVIRYVILEHRQLYLMVMIYGFYR